MFFYFVRTRYQWLLVTKQLNFCHKIELQMCRIGNPDVSFFCDCHVWFDLSVKNFFYGFWVLYISLRSKVFFSSSSLQLQFSVKWDLLFRVLEFKTFQDCSLWFKNRRETYPLLATKLGLVSHTVYCLMNIILTLRYL